MDICSSGESRGGEEVMIAVVVWDIPHEVWGMTRNHIDLIKGDASWGPARAQAVGRMGGALLNSHPGIAFHRMGARRPRGATSPTYAY